MFQGVSSSDARYDEFDEICFLGLQSQVYRRRGGRGKVPIDEWKKESMKGISLIYHLNSNMVASMR